MSAAETNPSEDERDPIVDEEAEAAAAEAAEIGGDVPPESDDPALRPLVESGEGEAEGFELAEEDLVENASHGDQNRFPEGDVGKPEEPTDAAYGEPDQVIPDDE
jgi:hypothetical protein